MNVTRGCRYWFRLARFALVLLALVLVVTPFMLGTLTMLALLWPPCAPAADALALNPQAETVSFAAADGLLVQAVFFPGTTTAAVILLPAYNSSRTSELHFAAVLNQAGFNVLTLDSRACSGNRQVTLGYDEIQDARAAYAYLQTRAEVNPAQVGLFGFSSAGATAIMAAARLPDVRSVVAMGGYHDYADALGESDQFWLNLYQSGARFAYRLLTGHDITVLNPLDALDHLPPRPLLLIYGSREVSLPGARVMLGRAEALGMDVHLWVVDGADHGDYLQIDPDGFRERVTRFERQTLLNESAP